MKKRGLLVVLLALVVAAAGVVYAHWEDTLTVKANVTAGFYDMAWSTYGTDDDGDYTNDPSGNDEGGPLPALTPYDRHGLASSEDPGEYGVGGYPGGALDRKDKDVGICTVALSTTNPNELVITIEDGYPSYYCTVYARYVNNGSVPMKSTSFAIQEYRGTTALIFPDTINGVEISHGYGAQDACGEQIDPGGTQWIEIGFHVNQEAVQNAVYRVRWSTGFVNWNEWDDDMCTYTINGVQLGP